MNKRGVAIEMAVVVMLVIFAFCSLIFAANIRESVRDSGLNSKMGVAQEFEQMGEDFYNRVIIKYKEGYTGYDLLGSIYLKDIYYDAEEVEKKLLYENYSGKDNYTLKLYAFIEEDEKKVRTLVLKVTVSYDLNTKTFDISEWYFNNPLNNTDFITNIEKEYE